MGTVYILGAGASHFACFPLAGGLWQFLKRELDQTKNEVIKQHGSQCRALVERVSEFIQKDKPPLCPPDLEMIFTLIDLVEIQGGVLGSLDFRGFDFRLCMVCKQSAASVSGTADGGWQPGDGAGRLRAGWSCR